MIKNFIYSQEANQDSYPFTLPKLPYDYDAFKPHFSSETFMYHHGKHQDAYVKKTNEILSINSELHDKTLEEIIIFSKKNNISLFNNAAQIWNHTFFWYSIKPNGGGIPTGNILDQINKDFGNYEYFVSQFKEAGLTQFGSGWVWIVLHDGKLLIQKTSNADTPIAENRKVIIGCDVWEHAYYIDYKNNRSLYLDTFLKHMINWDFANNNLK